MFQFQFSRREMWGAVLLAALLVVGLILRFLLFQRPAPVVIVPGDRTAVENVTEKEAGEKEIIIHVTGAVVSPGVYRLPESARVLDAVEAAGGFLPDADQEGLNLAAPLMDGQQVRVRRQSETTQSTEDTGKININTADAAELEKLPGIGPAKARAIVEHREKNGLFRRIEDLSAVSGIGEKTVEALREYVSLY